MGEIPLTKQSRFQFPLFLLQDVDSAHLKKKKLTPHEAEAAYKKFFYNVMIYAFDQLNKLECGLDEEEFCHAFGINVKAFTGRIYTAEASERIHKRSGDHEMKYGKKSATVQINKDHLWKLYSGDMDFFTFAVITAVMSRLGNTKKTKNKNKWQWITFRDIKTRMLGYTQWNDPTVKAAVSSVKITDLRIRNVLNAFEDKSFYRLRDGRAYVFTSITNYKSKNAFIEHFSTVKAQKHVRRDCKAQSEAQLAARIYKMEYEKQKVRALGEPRTDTTADQALAKINQDIRMERTEMIALIAKKFSVKLYDMDTLTRNQVRPLAEFRCIGEKLYAINQITADQHKAIQAMLDNATPDMPTQRTQDEHAKDARDFVEALRDKFDTDNK